MKDHKNIQDLIEKFVLGRCTPEEIEAVIAYFKERTPTEEMPSVEDILGQLREVPQMEERMADRIYARILEKGQKKEEALPPVKKCRKNRFLMAAATIAILISAGVFFFQDPFSQKDDPPGLPSEPSITLVLDNGEIRVIEPESSGEVTDASGQTLGKQDQARLTYKETSGKEEKLVYNTLKVPYGKRFDVVLSDGTTVYLNAGTSLRYPVKFIQGKKREVFLMGEAFFDVTEDKNHPFVVHTGELHVKVFGTRFNVSVYPEDRFTDVVLVDGSVGLYEGTQEMASLPAKAILTPGHKGSFDREEKTIGVNPVKTGIYTSWISGELSFRNMTFENILKKLERHYNISIEIRNKALAKEEFNASFGPEPIEKVLEYLRITYGMHYIVEEDRIIID
ncbi:FecR family protein [Sinomicrobium weinanense]|uniref:DUF4974 domain-containing protein n=1 Tax=Sinomicrobium weinanense TaxID=2842200 RepID=A0A926Q354_9FLAO|nr:FecR domain-containing protein [Sinomicrobium weinanense]MBC9796554.1 DUF4974 domain-containing protein [Sinomicrobium weinanense]MBU3123059.1 DUF4974 domain-containing protein [Sinomicrobium weinanense]